MTPRRASWQVVPLDIEVHDRHAFWCGAPELDRYIEDDAAQDVKRDVARVFVALQAGARAVRGYYSLRAASFQRDNLPADQARRLPRTPVPAVLLGRLAVDDGAKGQGLGAFLLMDAVNRTLLATRALAVRAMIADARDDAAAAFYRRYGFVAFSGETRRLFLPMGTIRRVAEG